MSKKRDMESPSLFQLACTFLKVGLLAFGGPFAGISYLERELVKQKNWISPEQFWEGVGMVQLSPGPVFLGTGIFCGHRLRGLGGAVMAAFGITFPAFVLTILLGYVYMYVKKLPSLNLTLTLLLSIVVGLLASVVWRDRDKFFKTKMQWLLGIVVFLLMSFVRFNPIALIISAGIFGAFFLGPQP